MILPRVKIIGERMLCQGPMPRPFPLLGQKAISDHLLTTCRYFSQYSLEMQAKTIQFLLKASVGESGACYFVRQPSKSPSCSSTFQCQSICQCIRWNPWELGIAVMTLVLKTLNLNNKTWTIAVDSTQLDKFGSKIFGCCFHFNSDQEKNCFK